MSGQKGAVDRPISSRKVTDVVLSGPLCIFATPLSGGNIMRWVLGCALLLSCLGMAAAQGDPISQDLTPLQGVWRVESMRVGGEEVTPPNKLARLFFTFTGEDLIASDSPTDVAKVKVDPSQQPAAIDISDEHHLVNLGIYEIVGTTLRLCANNPGGARPKTLDAAKGGKIYCMRFVRSQP